MSRMIALIFAAAAAFRLWLDWGATVKAGETFAMLSLGDFWTGFSPSSLAGFQGLAGGFWSVESQAKAMTVPLAAILLVLAALFWFMGRSAAPKRKQF